MHLATYLGKFEMLINHLQDLGDRVFIDNVIITKINYNLPKEYDPLLTMWGNVWKEENTLTQLTLRLLKEETKLKRKIVEDPSVGKTKTFFSHKHKRQIVGRFQLRSCLNSGSSTRPPLIVEQ